MMEGKALKAIRAFHHLTLSEISEKTGLSKSYISELESGKKEITYKVLDAYEKNFDISKSLIFLLSEALDDRNILPKPVKKLVDIINFLTADYDENIKFKGPRHSVNKVRDDKFQSMKYYLHSLGRSFSKAIRN